MPIGEKPILRFGPFALDTQCGQLRKNGLGLKLQGQPLQILELLLEKPGQLVTREEIRQRLWASDTFVDFDHSLNTAIKKLRQALGDEADTIPKPGSSSPTLGGSPSATWIFRATASGSRMFPIPRAHSGAAGLTAASAGN